MANVVLAPVHTRLLKTWTVLGGATVAVPNTGGTGAVTMATLTIPGGSMGPNGRLKIEHQWTHSGGVAGTWTMRIVFGGTNAFNIAGTAANLQQRASTLIWNKNSQSSQGISTLTTASYSQSAGALITAAVDTSANVTMTFTGQLSVGTETITLDQWFVECLYGA